MRRLRHLPLFLLLTLLPTLPARAAVFFVGSGTACTHATLPAAVAAAQLNGTGSDQIYLTEAQALTAPLSLSGTALQIYGGTTACGSTARSGLTGISLYPGSSISVGSNHVEIADVGFQRVSASGDEDRLIDAAGTFQLTLRNVLMIYGRARQGGALRLRGSAGAQAILQQVSIQKSVATELGGGIYCQGPVAMSWTGLVDIVGNYAGQNGGGVALTAGCTLDATANSASATGAVMIRNNNAALAGGGLYLTDSSPIGISGPTAATLRGGATYPVQISLNAAKVGGGVYVSNFDNLGETRLTLNDSIVYQNTADAVGGGLYGSGLTNILIDRTLTACHSASNCSSLSYNRALGTAPHPFRPTYTTGQGGAVFLDSNSGATARLTVRQTRIDHSQALNGASVIAAQGYAARVDAEGVMLHANADNGAAAISMLATAGSMRLAFLSTAANLTSTSGRLIAGGSTQIYSSVFGESWPNVIGPLSSSGSQIDCIIAPSTALPPVPTTGVTMVTDPNTLFVNPAAGDFHLLSTSRAIDYCDTYFYTPVDLDLDNQARGFETWVTNVYGPYDIGADEVAP